MTTKGTGYGISLAGLLGVILLSTPALAIEPPADSPAHRPAFTQSQAIAGDKIYAAHCAKCHGGSLQGASGPALSGAGFLAKWSAGGKTIADLRQSIKTAMPLGNPGSLTDPQYTEIVSFLLLRNGFAAGPISLDEETLATVLNPSAKAKPQLKLPAAPVKIAKASTSLPGDSQIIHPGPADWLLYNGSLSGQRYSPLRHINRGNAKNLTPVCLFQLGEVGAFQASPVVFEGMLYVTSAYNTYAINAQTCTKIWSHSYPSDNTVPVLVSRGVAIYKGKVFRVTPDGHVLALDAKTGALLWDAHLADKVHGYWLSAAPIAYDGKLFIGEAGADWGANGHIYALDTTSGKLLWTFSAIPTGNEPGAETWKSGADLGGGSSWTSYTLSPEEGLLYVSIGNPAPDFDGATRLGDNLYTNSVVALDYRTGKLVWYAQQVPHDVHDWDTAAAPIIYNQGGRHYMAVANKGGWLYIYDRKTHKLLAWPEVTTHSNIDALPDAKGVHACPGLLGGVEWNGPAYLPGEGALFVNSVDWCGVTRLTENRYVEGLAYFGGSYKSDPVAKAYGWTMAFDAATGKQLWSRQSPTPMLAALTPTAGGVVFTGDLNGHFLALDSRSGKTLYRFNTGGAVAGAASTYLIDGRQYVAVTSGNASRSTWETTGAAIVMIFALPQK